LFRSERVVLGTHSRVSSHSIYRRAWASLSSSKIVLGPAVWGTQQIVTAVPDGYTIGITNLSTLSLIPVINPEATYKPLGDLEHIAYIGGSPVVLAAHEATHVKPCMTS
jgi:Tripartite tricarboxylate transporter family receptor